VLAWVIERAAGTRLHELIARELWQPMGAEFDAEITLDAHGNPMADGGICACLRDLARFGQLYLEGGRTIVPEDWISDTIRGAPDGAQAFAAGGQPGPAGAHYRNCWWVWQPDVPFYQASGINGQAVYIHVPSQTVVAKFSTWPTASSAPAADLAARAVLAISNALQDGQLGG
jgi:CubicO group peptidase (beta-lactamase class C family)